MRPATDYERLQVSAVLQAWALHHPDPKLRSHLCGCLEVHGRYTLMESLGSALPRGMTPPEAHASMHLWLKRRGMPRAHVLRHVMRWHSGGVPAILEEQSHAEPEPLRRVRLAMEGQALRIVRELETGQWQARD